MWPPPLSRLLPKILHPGGKFLQDNADSIPEYPWQTRPAVAANSSGANWRAETLFIPVGNDNNTVWRTPWVTFGLIGLNIIIFAVTSSLAMRDDRQLALTAESVQQYIFEHPYLLNEERIEELQSHKIISRLEANQIKEALQQQDWPGASQIVPEAELAQYQRLLDQFAESRQQHIFSRLGYRPSSGRYWDVFTSIFMHGDIWHLLGNMLLFFAVGFSLEDIWGRTFFAGFYLAAGVAAALLHGAIYPDGSLIGASGAIAGVMGAFLIRLYKTRIKILYIFTWFIWGTFHLPSYALPILHSFPTDRKSVCRERV